MTLAERLREVALFLEAEAKDYDSENCPEPAAECRANAAKLNALADYVDGRVVAGVETSKVIPDPRWSGFRWRCVLKCRDEGAWGSTELDAIANQQQYADERDGRTLP